MSISHRSLAKVCKEILFLKAKAYLVFSDALLGIRTFWDLFGKSIVMFAIQHVPCFINIKVTFLYEVLQL